jgi:hypothetical protein
MPAEGMNTSKVKRGAALQPGQRGRGDEPAGEPEQRHSGQHGDGSQQAAQQQRARLRGKKGAQHGAQLARHGAFDDPSAETFMRRLRLQGNRFVVEAE